MTSRQQDEPLQPAGGSVQVQRTLRWILLCSRQDGGAQVAPAPTFTWWETAGGFSSSCFCSSFFSAWLESNGRHSKSIFSSVYYWATFPGPNCKKYWKRHKVQVVLI